MPSRNFEDLQKQGQLFTDVTEKATEQALGRAYRDAYDSTMNQIKDLYARLGSKLDLPEARKYKRLESLLASLEAEYKKLTGTTIKASGTASAQAYQEAFYGYTWSMEQATVGGESLDVAKVMKTGVSWGVIPTGAIEASVLSENSGLTYSKRITDNSLQTLSKIRATITRGIATGQGYAKLAREMKGVFDNGFSDAMRVIVTEMGKNYSEGFLLGHNKAVAAGIDVKKRWVASLDGRTRHDHALADGRYADENGNFHVGQSVGPAPGLLQGPDMLSQIIACRCRAVDELVGFPPKLRRVDGEIGPYVDFKTWASERGWSEKTGWK